MKSSCKEQRNALSFLWNGFLKENEIIISSKDSLEKSNLSIFIIYLDYWREISGLEILLDEK